MNNKDLIPFSSFIALRNPCSIHRHGLFMLRANFKEWFSDCTDDFYWTREENEEKMRKQCGKTGEHEEGGRSVLSCTETEHFPSHSWNLKRRDCERDRVQGTWHRLHGQLSSEFLPTNKNWFKNYGQLVPKAHSFSISVYEPLLNVPILVRYNWTVKQVNQSKGGRGETNYLKYQKQYGRLQNSYKPLI